MQPAILLGFEIGTHELPLHPEEPLGLFFWISLLLGVGIQMISIKVKRKPFTVILAFLTGLLVCEIACQLITGWELLLPVLLYFYLLTMLIGAGGCLLVMRLRQKRKEK